jgi:ABC-type transporter Mla maintaining outer membrane lipid asymmetry ATPase subunit MlaF
MTELSTMLEFSSVTLPAEARGRAEMRHVHFILPAGALLLLRLEAGNESLPLADAAEGLAVPQSGHIRWRGKTWHSFSTDAELMERALIGRVFEKQGWLSNLNVIENVTLSQRHHTTRPEREIIREADALAQYFGLPQVSRQRPAFVSSRELKMTEWVRALTGKPLLLLLERPENGVPDGDVPRLITAVQTTLQRGAAVIWQTDRDMVWNTSISSSEIRYRMQGADMVLIKEKDYEPTV